MGGGWGFDKLFDCCLYWEILNFETDVREIVRMFSILPETRFPQFLYNSNLDQNLKLRLILGNWDVSLTISTKVILCS